MVDFGLSKHGDLDVRRRGCADAPDWMTAPHAVLGTAGYMAPEQVTGVAADARSDQFALGLILYEMLTGRRAFRRKTSVQTLAAILEDEPAPLAKLRPDTPPPVVAIVERCLAKSPDDRYAMTRTLARELREALDVVVMESRSHHSGRHPAVRRRRWPVAAGAALVLLAAAGAGWWARSGPRAGAARRHDPLGRADSADRRVAVRQHLARPGRPGVRRRAGRDAHQQPHAAGAIPAHAAGGAGDGGAHRTGRQRPRRAAGVRRHARGHRLGYSGRQ